MSETPGRETDMLQALDLLHALDRVLDVVGDLLLHLCGVRAGVAA
jgi:hypothetical protein